MCRPLPGWHLAVQLGGSAEGREVGWKVQAGEPGRGRRADAAWSKHTKNFVRHLPPCTPPPTAESALEQSCEARKGVPQASEAAVDAPCAVGRRSWYSLWGGGRYSSRLPHVAVACRAWGPAPRASPRVQLLLCCALCHHASAPLPASSSSALSQPAGPLFLLQGSPFPVFPSKGRRGPDLRRWAISASRFRGRLSSGWAAGSSVPASPSSGYSQVTCQTGRPLASVRCLTGTVRGLVNHLRRISYAF